MWCAANQWSNNVKTLKLTTAKELNTSTSYWRNQTTTQTTRIEIMAMKTVERVTHTMLINIAEKKNCLWVQLQLNCKFRPENNNQRAI